jgi:hypothetical protein
MEVPQQTLPGRGVNPTPIELAPNTKFGFVEDAIYWGGAIHKDLHASDTPNGYPDVYVGCDGPCNPHERPEGYTVTIDPLKNAMWMLPGHEERHSYSVHRGALKDHAGVVAVARVAGQEDPNAAPERNFVPTSQMLDCAPKYTPGCVQNSTRGFARRDAEGQLIGYDQYGIRAPTSGRLPAISQAIWENKLIDKPDWLVEREQWLRSTHLGRDRRFACEGWCR